MTGTYDIAHARHIAVAGYPKLLWLAIVAIGLQYFVVRELGDPFWAKAVLGASHVLLIVVVAWNWRLLSMWIVALGLLLNLVVIYGNGGLMPIAPEAVKAMELSSHELRIGERFGAKSVLLHPEDTLFYGLSDRFQTTFPRPMLYSLGDVVLLLGLMLTLTGTVWHGLSRGSEEATDERRAV